jgi:hypothetical protein
MFIYLTAVCYDISNNILTHIADTTVMPEPYIN